MFFIMGISSAQKKLEFIQTILCKKCNHFGRLELFMTYTYFSLFFIPIFKWNKKFYAKVSCCGTLYMIDETLGKRIVKGEALTLSEQDLHEVYNGDSYTKNNACPNCGYLMAPDYLYCPKCGFKL
ncbi:zinc-ribbon domain-containing protein [Anaerocolumna sedimenticola]|uniref:Zinc-ribbon domain-containing protein n=1 Tax=Anaerocolumna sedimenticola TaxID=2696063 RepID=A0A6P1TLW8_9FIRM|nr:zinc ribbon domain-containing protein [Anaerocolumna sedimenticola]QHQ62034.1 zinc-ribbon domain-containing protein [Anaerocolumna sedimenticola]